MAAMAGSIVILVGVLLAAACLPARHNGLLWWVLAVLPLGYSLHHGWKTRQALEANAVVAIVGSLILTAAVVVVLLLVPESIHIYFLWSLVFLSLLAAGRRFWSSSELPTTAAEWLQVVGVLLAVGVTWAFLRALVYGIPDFDTRTIRDNIEVVGLATAFGITIVLSGWVYGAVKRNGP